jgi:hypothetical protein
MFALEKIANTKIHSVMQIKSGYIGNEVTMKMI